MTTPDWLLSDLAVWLVQSLAHVLWQGAVLLLLVAAVDAVLPKLSSRSRYAMWSVTLLLIFCCLPANLLLLAPETSAPEVERTRVVETIDLNGEAGRPGIGVGEFGSADRHPILTESVPVRHSSETGSAAVSSGLEAGRTETQELEATTADEPDADVWQHLSPIVMCVYVLGVGVMLARLLLATGATRRLRRSAVVIDDAVLLDRLDELASRVGLHVQPIVATSAKVAVPVVVGVLKPIIMLPACVLSGLDPAQLEAILLHELAHIRRRDPFINLLQRCVETVLFFQPAVWIVSRRMRVLREDCCDDMVLTCDVPQCLYAESLVAVSELRGDRTSGQALVLAAVNPAERSLRRRVLRILGEGTSSGPLRVTRGAVLTLVSLVVLSVSPVLFVMQHKATGQDNDSPYSDAIRKLIGDDPGESIYNDRLKRFKFRLDRMPVRTVETAEAFLHTYNRGDSDKDNPRKRPKLIGAWGDPLTNSIVVIGPPEAEQAIRQTLAEWQSEFVGIAGIDDTLEVQLVYLERERRRLLRELAALEAELAVREALPDTPERRQDPKFREQLKQNDEVIRQFTGRAASYEHELRVVDRKIEVIEKNIRRRDRLQPGKAVSTDPPARAAPGRQPSLELDESAAATENGQVVWRDDAVVWINLGTTDQMRRGLLLDVTSAADRSVKRQHLGRIEITQIVSQHLSRARILHEDASQRIGKNDRVFVLAENSNIPMTLSVLKAGTIIKDAHVGTGPFVTADVPDDAVRNWRDLVGRVVRNDIGVTEPVRERDLHPLDWARPARVISFDDLKFVDGSVPESMQRLIGRAVTIKGLMPPAYGAKDLTSFVLSADRDINNLARDPKPHELILVKLIEGKTADYTTAAIRVTGVLRTETISNKDRSSLRYVLEAGVVHVPDAVTEASGPASAPRAVEQQVAPQAVKSVVDAPEGAALSVPESTKATTVELKVVGPEGAFVRWPIEDAEELGPDELHYVLPATIRATSGKTVSFPITKLPGREGLKLFASVQIAPTTDVIAPYTKHNSIPLQITEEDIDQAASGKLVMKVVFLPSPRFQEFAIAGVETLTTTTRLDPGVSPLAEAQRLGSVLAVLNLGNRQLVDDKGRRPRATGLILNVMEEGVGGATMVEFSVGSDDGIEKDDRLKVFRPTPGQGRVYPFVAELWVRKVTPDHSLAEVIRRADWAVNVKRGDLVSLPWGAITVGGTVVGLKQEPVAGADVWLQTDHGSGDAVHVTTDAQGHFSLFVPREATADWKAALLWVLADGHELFVRDLNDLRSNDPDGRLTDQIIGLDTASTAAFTVRSRKDGKPLAGVRVVPSNIQSLSQPYPTLPLALQKRLAQTTGEDGQLAIRGVLRELLFDLRVEADGHGTQEFNVGFNGYDKADRMIEIGKAARVTGRVETDEPHLLKGLKLYFRTTDPDWLQPRYRDAGYQETDRLLSENAAAELPRRTHGVATVAVDSDGQFVIPAMASGRLWLETNLAAELPFGVRLSQSPITIEPGQDVTLRLHTAPRVKVGVKLMDEVSEPVTSRTVLRIDDGHGLRHEHLIFKGGHFETQVLAGDVQFRIENLLDEPSGSWKQLSGLPFTVAQDAADNMAELPPIRLQLAQP